MRLPRIQSLKAWLARWVLARARSETSVRRSTWRRLLRGGAAACGAAGLLLLALGLGVALWPIDPVPYLTVDASPEVVDRHGETLHVFINTQDHWAMPRGLEQVSPWLVQATIAAEDQRFERHPGVDPLAIARAIGQNLRGQRVVSGASTLAMQVAKLGGVDSRSLGGKLRQAATALRLQHTLGREALLQAYLNRAPYGLNLIGCEAAARRYFGKPSAELTLPEAALLAGLPRSPTRLMPLAHPQRAKARRNDVLRRMLAERMISPSEYERAAASPLLAMRHAFPGDAPHLATRLRSAIPTGGQLVTTLDARAQRMLQDLLAEHFTHLGGSVSAGAAIVLDPRTGEVLARAGSPDFFNVPGAGQYDASSAARAPGSALKPFTFALALEANRLYPSEQLLDDTLDYGSYNPANFDGRFRGMVSAEDALRQSLNIPAVMLLERIGPQSLHATLRRAGLSTLTREPEEYGLGLTLGNCEVRLDQLATAYAALANLGELHPLRELTQTTATAQPVRLFSRETSLALYRILGQPLPSEVDRQLAGTVDNLGPVCWKTGTSTNNCDAWAFVFNANYVVGIWLGNHDGRPSRALVGAHAALPLAGRVMRSLPVRGLGAQPRPAWPAMDAAALREAEVCAASGLPATRWCQQRRRVLFPRSQYLNRNCSVHWPGATPQSIASHWPGAARGWDLATVRPPDAALMATSGELPGAMTLQVTSPAPNSAYVLTGEPNGDRIALRSSFAAGEKVHWFLNQRYLGHAEGHAPLMLTLEAGEHELLALAPGNRIARSHFIVSAPQSDPTRRYAAR